LYEAPKELCCAVWRRRHKIKNFVKELPGKVKRGVIAIPGHVKSAGKAIWKGIKEIPSFVKYVFQSLWGVLKKIPGAIMSVLNWIGRGLKNIGEAIGNIFMKFFSFLHTTLMAIVTFLRGITLRDIWNGFCSLVRAVFIDAPKAIGRFIVSFGRTTYDVLKAVFGSLGECIWHIGHCILWLIKYIPQKIWTIIEAMGTSLVKAWEEVLVFVNPKRM
jgi:phage-related protein